jgi:hypothetical protein
MSVISSDYSSNGIPLNRQAVRPFFQGVPVFNERYDASSDALCCLVALREILRVYRMRTEWTVKAQAP